LRACVKPFMDCNAPSESVLSLCPRQHRKLSLDDPTKPSTIRSLRRFPPPCTCCSFPPLRNTAS
jgi:hypothetical protein